MFFINHTLKVKYPHSQLMVRDMYGRIFILGCIKLFTDAKINVCVQRHVHDITVVSVYSKNIKSSLIRIISNNVFIY